MLPCCNQIKQQHLYLESYYEKTCGHQETYYLDMAARLFQNLFLKVAVLETTLEALKEESAVAVLPSSTTPAAEWDRECVEHIAQHVAANDRAESAIREFGGMKLSKQTDFLFRTSHTNFIL